MLIHQNFVDNRCVFGIAHFKCYFTYHIVQLDTKYAQRNSEKSVTQTIYMETEMICYISADIIRYTYSTILVFRAETITTQKKLCRSGHLLIN